VTPASTCLLCCRPVGPAQPRCPAFARAGVAAHAGCCGGCVTTRPDAAGGVPADRPGAAA
jgi:hypothetical protein